MGKGIFGFICLMNSKTKAIQPTRRSPGTGVSKNFIIHLEAFFFNLFSSFT